MKVGMNSASSYFYSLSLCSWPHYCEPIFSFDHLTDTRQSQSQSQSQTQTAINESMSWMLTKCRLYKIGVINEVSCTQSKHQLCPQQRGQESEYP